MKHNEEERIDKKVDRNKLQTSKSKSVKCNGEQQILTEPVAGVGGEDRFVGEEGYASSLRTLSPGVSL